MPLRIKSLKLSTKNKTMILVLALFLFTIVIFSILRQVDIKQLIALSLKDYKEQVEYIYKTVLKKSDEFYESRAKANYKSQQIKHFLKEENVKELKKLSINRWNILKEENPYLINMKFYNNKGNLITYLGSLNKSHKPNEKNYFYLEDNKLSYHIITPFFEKEKIVAFIEFSFKADYIIKQIKEFSNLNAHIIFNNKGKDNINLIEHIINLNNKDGKNIAKMVFYQDISTQQNNIKNTLYEAIAISIALMFVIICILHFGFKVLIKKLELSENSLKNLNLTLEQKVQNELAKRLEQEKILMQQNRLASMGEMIANIAHQYRQPLATLSCIITHISLLYDLNKLNKSEFKKQEQKAQDLIIHMSKTIDDFRNFFKSDKIKEEFNLITNINKALNLIEPALHNHNINIIFDEKDEIKIYAYANQFSQVILNILANAKDMLLERKVKNPWIKIYLQNLKEEVIINIEDNAKGISIKPIEKIFEPYISTKHASSGTGIGLYMCNVIIKDNLKGSLWAKNTQQGAIFSIKLPTITTA